MHSDGQHTTWEGASPQIHWSRGPEREDLLQWMAAELQEVPPTEHAVLYLVVAGAVPHRPPDVARHVLGSLLQWEPEESPPDIHYSP